MILEHKTTFSKYLSTYVDLPGSHKVQIREERWSGCIPPVFVTSALWYHCYLSERPRMGQVSSPRCLSVKEQQVSYHRLVISGNYDSGNFLLGFCRVSQPSIRHSWETPNQKATEDRLDLQA
jgi:hypothetical protein